MLAAWTVGPGEPALHDSLIGPGPPGHRFHMNAPFGGCLSQSRRDFLREGEAPGRQTSPRRTWKQLALFWKRHSKACALKFTLRVGKCRWGEAQQTDDDW